MKKRYLAIFDLDGTLFDTGEVNYYAYRDALAMFRVELDYDYFVKKCNGRHYTEFLPEIMGEAAAHMEEVHEAKKTAYRENLDKAKVNAHLVEIIKSIRKTYHTALVTTASKKNAMEILDYFGCRNLFEYMVFQEDMTQTKPDPEGFLLAMKHFGMEAGQVVIFEDSDVGIQAARAAGAAVIVIDKF